MPISLVYAVLTDGNHSVLLTHVLHFKLHLNPFTTSQLPQHPLLQNRPSSASWNDFYSRSTATEGWNSYAATPAAGTPGPDQSPNIDDGDDDAVQVQRHIDSTAVLPFSRLLWVPPVPIPSLYNKRLVSHITTLHLKLTTRFDFNDNERIWRHEDSYSIKDVLEGIPFFGPVYFMNRRMAAYAASNVYRILCRVSPLALFRSGQKQSLLGQQARRDNEEALPDEHETETLQHYHERASPSMGFHKLPASTASTGIHEVDSSAHRRSPVTGLDLQYPSSSMGHGESQVQQLSLGSSPIKAQGYIFGHLKAQPAAPQMSTASLEQTGPTIDPDHA